MPNFDVHNCPTCGQSLLHSEKYTKAEAEVQAAKEDGFLPMNENALLKVEYGDGFVMEFNPIEEFGLLFEELAKSYFDRWLPSGPGPLKRFTIFAFRRARKFLNELFFREPCL